MQDNEAPRGKTIDVKIFWQAIGMRAIGAAVVTAADARGPAGFLALSATQIGRASCRERV